jgi:hypothetical protein
VDLAYLLLKRLEDEVDVHPLNADHPKFSGKLSDENEKMLDGVMLAVLQSDEITSASFGNRRNPLDNGFAAAVATCCVAYCQEQGANRGQFLSMIPDDLRGTRDAKKVTTKIFGALRTSLSGDKDSVHFLNTITWLFNKWALKYRNTVGMAVMRCQKIRWDIVRKNALPYRIEKKRTKNGIIENIIFGAPKNVGYSPLINAVEKNVLRSLAQVGYHIPMKNLEDEWKSLTAQEQHDRFPNFIRDVKDHFNDYNDDSSKVVGRQYKRRIYFEKVTGDKPPSAKKNKTIEPKVLSKHLADISKKVFSSEKLREKIPLATSSMVLVVNTIYEDMVTEALNQKFDLEKYFGKQKATALMSELATFSDSFIKLKESHKVEYNRFITTNQYGLLDEPDEDEDSGSHETPG